jgi:DNA-binding FadR family transcriptional regulator
LAPLEPRHAEFQADLLAVSLIPLREALKVLSGEGLVTYVPQRGYFVTRLEDDAIRQIYDARSLVESEERRRRPRAGGWRWPPHRSTPVLPSG